MQKVKVARYISGKRPDYAKDESSSEESDFEEIIEQRQKQQLDQNYDKPHHVDDSFIEPSEIEDRRIRRLKLLAEIDAEELHKEREERHRHIDEPVLLENDNDIKDGENLQNKDDDYEGTNDNDAKNKSNNFKQRTQRIDLDTESDSDSDMSESQIENRRMHLRERMLKQQQQEEILLKEEENNSDESVESESSEYEDDNEPEIQDEPRLKPLFVRKQDRATMQEKDREAQKQKRLDSEKKMQSKERRRQTLRMVEECIRREIEKETNKVNNIN